jgi:MerR family redox-sensitive transcriptional activator SoxR
VNKRELTIGEVARQAGLRTSAVRYYESIGLLPVARRVHGQRRYSPATIQLLSVIRLAQQAGFRVAEIQLLLHGQPSGATPAERWRPLVERKIDEIDALIAYARQTRGLLEQLASCDCEALEQCGAVAQQAGRQ